MRRWQLSILGGVLITCVLAVVATLTQSISLVRGIFWQCSLFGYRSCPANELCEGTPIDVFFGLLCVMLSVPIYSLLTYGALRLFAKKSSREEIP
jgi:hypothetical protein